MKKSICALLFISMAVSVFSIEFDWKPPTYTNETNSNHAVILNNALVSAFGKAEDDIKNIIGGMDIEPADFIQAWGNAAIFAGHGATQRGYSGYRIGTVSIGSMFGGQFPVSPAEFFKNPQSLFAELNKGDIAFGVSPQFVNAQVGINMSFLVKNLYLGIRAGGANFDDLFNLDILSFNSKNFGLLVNYQLLPRINLLGIIDWKGVNLGTGLIYQNTNVGVRIPMGKISQPVDSNITLNIEPRINFTLDINTYTIPLEVITALKIAVVNVPFGLGADLGFGTSGLHVGMDGKITVNGLASDYKEDQPGELTVTAGGEASPVAFNVKLMTGVGFNLGPVLIDIPFTYYFRGNGVSLGFTAGVSF